MSTSLLRPGRYHAKQAIPISRYRTLSTSTTPEPEASVLPAGERFLILAVHRWPPETGDPTYVELARESEGFLGPRALEVGRDTVNLDGWRAEYARCLAHVEPEIESRAARARSLLPDQPTTVQTGRYEAVTDLEISRAFSSQWHEGADSGRHRARLPAGERLQVLKIEGDTAQIARETDGFKVVHSYTNGDGYMRLSEWELPVAGLLGGAVAVPPEDS